MGINEAAFENHIVGALTTGNIGYEKETTTAYSKKLAVIPDRLISFIKATQPAAYDALLPCGLIVYYCPPKLLTLTLQN